MRTWTQCFSDFINNLSTTNFRIFVTVLVSAVFVSVITAGIILQRTMDAVIVGLVMSFLVAFAGLDVKQFSVKRNTEIVTPPDSTVKKTNADNDNA